MDDVPKKQEKSEKLVGDLEKRAELGEARTLWISQLTSQL